MFGLEYLISPTAVDEFRTKSWGQQASYIPGSESKFADLFGWDDLNHIMNNCRLSWEGIRLVHETRNLPHEALHSLDHWLAKGATLIVNSVNQIDPIVGRFATSLGNELNTHVNINAYTSCPTKQGFDNHYDKHDVFIVQIAGTKSWTVFEPTRRWPLEREAQPKGNPPDTEPYLQCDVTPGDVLYIPRGHWHYAVAVTPSIHFTVGPQARTGIDLLLWLTQQLMDNDEFFRKDFPIVRAREFGGDRSDDELQAHLSAFRSRLNEVVGRESFFEGFLRYCMTANRVRRTYQLPNDWTLRDTITPDTMFTRPPDQKALIRYDPETRCAVVLTRGAQLNLNELSKELLAAIFEGDGPMCGRVLLTTCPETSWDQLKGPLLQMFGNGVLILADVDDV
jgi:ribosomal protein L16 Arg81 hydroxylase